MSTSIVEPRNPRNHVPKFQAKFGVAKEEPHGPRERFVQGYRQRLHHHVSGTRKAPSLERALLPFDVGQKKNAFTSL